MSDVKLDTWQDTQKLFDLDNNNGFGMCGVMDDRYVCCADKIILFEDSINLYNFAMMQKLHQKKFGYENAS